MNTEKDLQESTEQELTIPVVVPRTFTLTWKDAQKEPPKEGGRYWCVVRDINDLGHFILPMELCLPSRKYGHKMVKQCTT